MTTTLPSIEDDIVLLPVPRQYLEAMVQALADAIAANGNGGHPPGGRARRKSTDLGELPWREEEFRRLRPYLRDRPMILTMLEMAAKCPGTGVPFADVCEGAGVSKETARAALAGFTKLVHAKFGRSNWPVAFDKVPRGEGEHYVLYRMDEETAQAWRQAAV